MSEVVEHLDLIRRYCPGLEIHTPEQIARHIPGDPTTCWPWDGWISQQGYGVVWLKRAPSSSGQATSVPIHRYMFDLLVGEIPEGWHVHHRCEHRPCWNLFHLEALTVKEHHDRHSGLPLDA